MFKFILRLLRVLKALYALSRVQGDCVIPVPPDWGRGK